MAAVVALASCAKDPFVVNRTTCPAVIVPQYAGEITRFDPADSRDASAIDVTASLTGVRGLCTEGGAVTASAVRFDVVAQRRDVAAARTVTLPVFVAVVRGGNAIVAKSLSEVRLDFAAGAARATGTGAAEVGVNRDAARLPVDINRKVTRERRAGEIDAASDPLAAPDVRDAVRAATFEVLVGFQLSSADLAWNAQK